MSRSADRLATGAFALFLTLGSAPAIGQDAQQEPIANRTPDAKDVAMTPLNDLNLAKDDIPPVLLAAAADPYASTGIRSCAQISEALAPLDAALGPDLDISDSDNDRVSAGAVAKSVVASFVPFRGILREITGAAEHQRTFRAAIYAGAVRRGYLKGLGQQKGCKYPARPAVDKNAPIPATKTSKSGPEPEGYVSQPVIQGEPSPDTKKPDSRRRP